MNEQEINGKVFSMTDLGQVTARLRQEGKTIVQCHGVFDLLHPGHLRHFVAAKKLGDVLVVTLTSDRYVNKGPDRPVFNQNLRAESIASIGCVDYVAINDHPMSSEALTELKPNIYVKGGEYADLEGDVTGGIKIEKEAVEAHGGKIHFTNEATFSSSSLINRFLDTYPTETKLFLQEFRQKYSATDIMNALESIRGKRVLVIGETIVDEYHYVRPLGRSAKGNVVAQRFQNDESFAGGIIACANHIAGFCDDVHVVTCLGAVDSKEEFVRSKLKTNVTPRFFYREGMPTIVKRRFVDSAFLGKLFEVYYFNDEMTPPNLDAEIRAHLEEVIHEYDVVICLDYGHGMLTPETIRFLEQHAKFLALNTQTNAANIGFNLVTKYPRTDFLCIDEPELRLAAGDRLGAVEDLLKNVASRACSRRAIVTRGHRGCLAYDVDQGFVSIPVLSQKVVDSVGAGDAFLAIVSPLVSTGMPMELVGFIGNAVGALAVGIVGNRGSVEPVALSKFIKTLLA